MDDEWKPIGYNGRFYQLIKNSKQKRDNKAKKEEEKKGKDDILQSLEEQNMYIQELEQKIDNFERKQVEHLENAEKLGKLYDEGVIDQYGTLLKK